MVAGAALYDTCILIDYLCARPEARTELESHANRAISIITWMEVLVGARPETEVATRAFLQNFQVLPLDEATAERAVALRRERKIKLPDAMILATAEVTGRTLVTRNTRDFPAGSPGVRLPYEI